MTVIRVQNVNSWLITDNTDIKFKLGAALRARPKGYYHNAAYRAKRWDGWRRFFNEKSGVFLTGLLPEVKAALTISKIPYTIEDQSEPVQWTETSIDNQFLNRWLPKGFNPITLHDYQPDLVNQALKYHRGIVQAPTGSGKTFVLVSLLKCLPPKTPILFLTRSKNLTDQNYEEMKTWGVKGLGRWYEDFKEPNDIMCATIHPATFESLEEMLPKFKAVFVDEVHEAVSAVPIEAYRKMTGACIRIGFSATPFRYNKKQIDKEHKLLVKGHFGPVFKTHTTATGYLTAKDLQERGILSKSNCTFYRLAEPDLAYETYQQAVKLGIEENFALHQFVADLARSREGRTLIIVERIKQGEYLKQLMPEADWIYGKHKLEERIPVINSLKAGEKTIAIVMRQIITAGINIFIHDLINAAGGDAAHNLIQQIGRGLRPANDKERLEFHDILFLINDYLRRHSEWRMKVLEREGHLVSVKDTSEIFG